MHAGVDSGCSTASDGLRWSSAPPFHENLGLSGFPGKDAIGRRRGAGAGQAKHASGHRREPSFASAEAGAASTARRLAERTSCNGQFQSWLHSSMRPAGVSEMPCTAAASAMATCVNRLAPTRPGLLAMASGKLLAPLPLVPSDNTTSG